MSQVICRVSASILAAFKQRPLAGGLLMAVCLLSLAGCRNAYWSPDSKSIVLDLDGKLRVFDVARGSATTLDTSGRYVVNPAYAPNGKLLAYYGLTRRGEALQSSDLYVRDRTTNTERQLVDGVTPLEGTDPRTKTTGRLAAEELGLTLKMLAPLAWSPDSRRLAYIRWKKDDYWIEVVDVATGAVSPLAVKGQPQASPAWSPDGTRIAYLAGRIERPSDGTKSNADLWVIDADGRNPKRLLASTTQSGIWPFSPPGWTRDGAGIIVFTDPARPDAAASRNHEPDFMDAFRQEARVVPAAGGAGRVLARLPTAMGMVAPDLKSLVYLGGDQLTEVVYKAAPFKTGRVLDHLPAQIRAVGPSEEPSGGVFAFPMLSPDGKTVALPTDNPKTRRPELRLYDLATGKKRVHPIR